MKLRLTLTAIILAVLCSSVVSKYKRTDLLKKDLIPLRPEVLGCKGDITKNDEFGLTIEKEKVKDLEPAVEKWISTYDKLHNLMKDEKKLNKMKSKDFDKLKKDVAALKKSKEKLIPDCRRIIKESQLKNMEKHYLMTLNTATPEDEKKLQKIIVFMKENKIAIPTPEPLTTPSESSRGKVESPLGKVDSSRGLIVSPLGQVEKSGGQVELSRVQVEPPLGQVESSGGQVEVSRGIVEAPRGQVESLPGKVAPGNGEGEALGSMKKAGKTYLRGKSTAVNDTIAEEKTDKIDNKGIAGVAVVVIAVIVLCGCLAVCKGCGAKKEADDQNALLPIHNAPGAVPPAGFEPPYEIYDPLARPPYRGGLSKDEDERRSLLSSDD